tara:strand:+ start:1355 stop:1615 length:261 start_codon:yes stop_codon:yes gene_type:complete
VKDSDIERILAGRTIRRRGKIIWPLAAGKGQYRFDEALKVTVVASDAHERGPKPAQATLDTRLDDLGKAAAWGYNPKPAESERRRT